MKLPLQKDAEYVRGIHVESDYGLRPLMGCPDRKLYYLSILTV